MYEFKTITGETLRLDPNLTLAQLVEQGFEVRLGSPNEPKVPGVFYSESQSKNVLPLDTWCNCTVPRPRSPEKKECCGCGKKIYWMCSKENGE